MAISSWEKETANESSDLSPKTPRIYSQRCLFKYSFIVFFDRVDYFSMILMFFAMISRHFAVILDRKRSLNPFILSHDKTVKIFLVSLIAIFFHL